MDTLAGSLDNLALAATNDKTALQQLTAANLALTTTVSTLTIANKKLTNTVPLIQLTKGWSSRSWSGKQTQSRLGQLLLDAWIQNLSHHCNLWGNVEASRSRCVRNCSRHKRWKGF
jgi:hypothetical protein